MQTEVKLSFPLHPLGRFKNLYDPCESSLSCCLQHRQSLVLGIWSLNGSCLSHPPPPSHSLTHSLPLHFHLTTSTPVTRLSRICPTFSLSKLRLRPHGLAQAPLLHEDFPDGTTGESALRCATWQLALIFHGFAAVLVCLLHRQITQYFQSSISFFVL